jgi:hypothetical protein
MSASSIDPCWELGDLGVESVMLARLTEDIEQRLGRPVQPGTLLDHPRLDELASVLGAPPRNAAVEPEPADPRPAAAAEPEPAGAVDPEPAAAVDPQPTATAKSRPGPVPHGVAVVGMAARFPGASDVDAFWENLLAGVCSVGDGPLGRRAAL